MSPYDIIFNLYEKGSPAADILIRHSEQVRDKSLAVAERLPHLKPDLDFIAEAAMLHDIGACRTDAPGIHCCGDQPYIRHGVIGRSVLERYGFRRHALVCERHVGVGISAADIEAGRLPLPRRDMLPVSVEETIICYADEFFSKTNGGKEHSLERIIAGLERRGAEKVRRFMAWHHQFAADHRQE